MAFVHRAQQTCAATYLVALALQFYALGLGIFGAASFMPHATLGYLLIVGAMTLAALTLFARLPRPTVLLAAAIVPLTILQPVLALVPRASAPAVAALHAVNALVIVALAGVVAFRSRPRDDAPVSGRAPA
jgi:hypothetical protein